MVGIASLPICMQHIKRIVYIPEIQPRAKTDLLVQCFDREVISKSQFQGKYILCNSALGKKKSDVLSAL